MNKEEFWTRLQVMGMTVREFSERTQIPLRTVYSYLKGERRIPDYLEILLKQIEDEWNDPV